MGNCVPSLRCAETSRSLPTILFLPVWRYVECLQKRGVARTKQGVARLQELQPARQVEVIGGVVVPSGPTSLQ